jgi:hypothetical protein
MKINKIVLVSPCFSCGLGLVFDLFLALDMRLECLKNDLYSTKISNKRFNIVKNDVYWEKLPNGKYNLTNRGFFHLRNHSKLVFAKKNYQFKEDIFVLNEHNPRLILENNEKTLFVLMVRDPVDAVYSWHRRFKMDDRGVDFNDYLSRIIYLNKHSPYSLFQLPPFELFSVFCALFLSLFASKNSFHILKFEDLKVGNLESFKSCLDACGVINSSEKIIEAINLLNGLESNNSGEYNATNPSGKINEWKDRMSRQQHDKMLSSPLVKEIAGFFGYLENEIKLDEVFSWDCEFSIELQKIKEKTLIESGQNEKNVSELLELLSINISQYFDELLDIDIPNGFSFSRNGVDGLNALKTVMEFISEIYGVHKEEKPKFILDIIVSMTNLLGKSMQNNNLKYCLTDKVMF